MEKLTMTVKEVRRDLLGNSVSLPTLYQWTERDDFPLIRIGRKKLIPVEPFKAWLSDQTGKIL